MKRSHLTLKSLLKGLRRAQKEGKEIKNASKIFKISKK